MRTHTHRCFVFPSPVRRVFLTGVRDRAPAQIEIQRFLNCNCYLIPRRVPSPVLLRMLAITLSAALPLTRA